MKRDYLLFIGLALIILLLDQVSKWMVVTHIEAHQTLSVIPGFFSLVLVKNRGMAFGIFSQTRSGFYYYFLLSTTIGAIGVILFSFFWIKSSKKWLTVGLSLILGGAVGNLVDRLRLGYVIDFLDFFLKGYHWPAFNVADSAVTVGTFWLLFNIIQGRKIIEAK
ncbi:MAG: signal peptidase II [Deltaproteobacteria bacterium]|nr:signal peptidase II [Deltaproteobacteria bacterium]MBW2104537.1 signal peptidase II [Deltaproteobacteria bacterium]MBW2333074.1 signal peptidase II [Deltaproteobacteria bacterium]